MMETKYNILLQITSETINWVNKKECEFYAELVDFPSLYDKNSTSVNRTKIPVVSPDIPPGKDGYLHVQVPENIAGYDIMKVHTNHPLTGNMYTYSFPLTSPAHVADEAINAKKEKIKIKKEITDSVLFVQQGDNTYAFNLNNGMLLSVKRNGMDIHFGHGPVLTSSVKTLETMVRYYQSDSGYVIISEYKSIPGGVDYESPYFAYYWTIRPDGFLQLDYSYGPENGDHALLGISFQYPEEGVTGAKYMGNGPYRVWKNRLKGVETDVWEKSYNNTRTGQSWDYPEFKGYHSRLYWADIKADKRSFRVINASEQDIYLGLFKPAGYLNNDIEQLEPPFPKGDISFMHGIPAIGTKFRKANRLGPQGQLNMTNRWGNKIPFKGKLLFDFGID